MARAQCGNCWVWMVRFVSCHPVWNLLQTRRLAIRIHSSPAGSPHSPTLQQLQQKLPVGFHTMMPARRLSNRSQTRLRGCRMNAGISPPLNEEPPPQTLLLYLPWFSSPALCSQTIEHPVNTKKSEEMAHIVSDPRPNFSTPNSIP